ncbi:MAG: C10 family peptidase [Tannerella sp.]|jgi:hypothetical protein|nr:C10 family peptidase [Tannerella sp.]
MNAKYVILLLSLFVETILQAENVPQAKALQVATQFLWQQENVAIRNSLAPPVELVHAEEPYYYVFSPEGEKGFVIISGDDRARPVLAYSTQNSFDALNCPPNVKTWMENYRQELKFLLREDPDISRHPQWQQPFGDLSPKLRSETILYTVSWDQDAPYNNHCPQLSAGRALTGCVATSMAIVMKYHADREYAAHGTGYYSYNSDGKIYATDFGPYDWTNMPDRTEDFTADIQREAVARLMYHCAISIESVFGTNGTGSYNWNTSVALTSFFGFDKKLGYIEKANYSDNEWKNIIRNEIDAERPVIYDGDNPAEQAGHSFLLTGYSDADMYFFNWGWGGRYNGWFSLSALTPAYGHNYSTNQGMVTGIQKNAGDDISTLRFVKTSKQSSIPDGIVKTGNGNTFVIHGGMFENRSYLPFTGSISAALTDAGGNMKQIIGRNDNVRLERGYAWSSTRYIGDMYCSVTLPYAADDRICFVTSEDGGQTWQTIYGAPGIPLETVVGNEETNLSPSVHIFAADGSLTVESPYSETLRVYSLTGQALFEGFKQEGKQRFDLRLPEGIVIVRVNNRTQKVRIK